MREEYLYFDEPTQVKFIDVNSYQDSENPEPRWLGGIAYCGEIICGCCGGVITLEDLYADWRDFAHKDYPDIDSPLEPYKYWVDIEENIRGE